MLRRTWTAARAVRPRRRVLPGRAAPGRTSRRGPARRIPVYGGGGSDDAIDALAPESTRSCCGASRWPRPPTFMDRVRRRRRRPAGLRFSVSTRPILADTEGEAWDRAHALSSTRPGAAPAPAADDGAERRLPAPARRRPRARGVRPLPVDPARRRHRRPGQLARRSSAHRTRSPRRSPTTSTRRRRRCSSAATSRWPTPRVRPGADPAGPGPGRRTGPGPAAAR